MTVEVWWSSLVVAGRDLLGMLDATERTRVESLERPADRGRSMLGAALLRVAAGSRLAVAPGEVVVDRTCADCGGPHGAPRILGPGVRPPWVSVSHSGLLAVVAVSDRGPVGVDVQRVSDLPDPAEAREWVRREAQLKAGPESLAALVHELRAPLAGYVAALVAPADDGGPEIRHWPPPAEQGGDETCGVTVS
jgi:4'-phosphopantetheinyl transferase